MMSINLLPKKESNSNLIIILCILLCILMGGLGVCTFFYSKYLKEQLAAIEKDYRSVHAQIDALSDPVGEENSEIESRFEELQLIADDLDLYEPYTVELFTKMIELLPDTGYIMDIEFNRVDSLMNFTVRFENYKEAGYLAARLQDETWVNEITLSSIQAAEFDVQEKNAGKLSRFDAKFSIQVKPSEWKKDRPLKDTADVNQAEQLETMVEEK